MFILCQQRDKTKETRLVIVFNLSEEYCVFCVLISSFSLYHSWQGFIFFLCTDFFMLRYYCMREGEVFIQYPLYTRIAVETSSS